MTAPAGIDSPLLYQDGFGTRWQGLDAESGDAVEILSFGSEFVDAPDFAAAIGERVARLARVRHTLYARARRLDRPAEDSLLLISDRIAGWRLAEVLTVVEREKLTIDISAILALMRQLIPAVALFSRHQRDAAIGTVGPERLILTPQSRLVITEHALAPGLEHLHYSRERLWRDLRVVLPPSASPTRIPPTADVVGMGIVTLSLLHGRLLTEDEYLFSLGDLVESATESTGGERKKVSDGLGQWLARALQFEERSGFQSPQEAQVAFEEVLAKERAYVTTPAQLDLFVARLEKITGPPVAPSAPAPIPIASAPAVVSQRPAPEVADLRLAPTPEPLPAPAPVVPALAAVAGEPTPAPRVAPGVARPATPAATALAPEAPETVMGRLRGRLPLVAGVLLLIALIEAALIGWLVTRNGGQALGDEGEIVIQTRPIAARVVVDGEERGATPLTLQLSAGAHILEVRVGRSEPRVIPIDVRAGVQSTMYVELLSVATVGGLDVRSDPTRARVTVDGRYRGDAPLVLKDLPPGDHEVLLEAGRQKVRQLVRVEAGLTSQLVVPMSGR